MSNVNFEEVKEFLIELAHEAGDIIKSKSGKESFDDKKNSVDLVTAIDKLVEKTVSTKIFAKYPNYKFIGEETFIEGETKLTDDPTFIVDPIDGTTNFIHNFPYSCISLGFTVNQIPQVGVIFNPHLNLLYSAIKGKGAFLNNEPLPNLSSKPLTLQSSIIALESGSDREGEIFDVKLETFKSLLSRNHGFIHGFRSFGSAAMNISHTATGQLDAYWEGGCQSWDVAAGWVILEETGGKVVSGNKGGWTTPVDSRVYLFVRGAPEADQKKFIEDFWSNIKGQLNY
ncbi:Inositol monophosphatase 2 [Wickerhamomyces ciferrii]|uniref:Inositol-1-monophosphatase n=1 Tax=Wickerhamomyces ciferrii (strain ATCC 14091 / BCRC 22168 / CBS 111 / JCM 3599 / NBRC 0793 / NRRL Y-1031 F-60-10) TaxID=1206466 RepID=K0KT69_WICCF|nr:Inositol monophosphatase 2 [Wickerhamomyces ciferrii]CCH45227.1 Inositol monophosphatase 2 [Wickerhamomyces ciferrii]